MAQSYQRKRKKMSDAQEDDIFPFSDLADVLVESVIRELSTAKASKATDLYREIRERRESRREKEKEKVEKDKKAKRKDKRKKEDRAPRNLNSLLAVSPSVARLVLSSSAEWRVDLEGLAYVAWCLGVKPRDEAIIQDRGTRLEHQVLAEEQAQPRRFPEDSQTVTGSSGSGIPPGHLILDHAQPGHMDTRTTSRPRLGLLSDMASQGLIRGLELRGYWGNSIFGDSGCFDFPVDVSCFENEWAPFLSEVAPLLTRLDIGRCSDEEGPSDAHLAPLISSPASFPWLQSVSLLFVTDRYSEDMAFFLDIGLGRLERWCTADALLKLTALPSLRDVSILIEESESARTWTDYDCGYNEHARILVDMALRILSDPRATESPVLVRTALDLARDVAVFVRSATWDWVSEFGTSLNTMGPMLQQILSLLLRPPPEGPQWTPYTSAVIQSLAVDVLEFMADSYYDSFNHEDMRGPMRGWTHGGLPYAFGINLRKSGQLSTLLGLALPVQSDAAVAAALSESFVETGRPGVTPLEVAQRVPLKATSLLGKLYSAMDRSGWRMDMYLDGELQALASSRSEKATLAAFYDALFDFDRPENQLRATHFFQQLNEPVAFTKCPVGPFVAALAQRVLESNLLQDLGAAAGASGGGHVDPTRIPEWFLAATRSLRALRLAAVKRKVPASPVEAEDATVLLNLLSIPGLDLSKAKRSIMPQIAVLLSGALDQPRASAKAETLALDILRAFGRHADLVYNSDSVFWPVEDAGQASRTLDVFYVLPSLAITLLSKPELLPEDRLLGVIRSAQGKAMGVMREGTVRLEPVPFKRFERLFGIALDDLVPLEVRSPALVFSALCVSISFGTDKVQQRGDWTDSPSLRALYREWLPSLEHLPPLPKLKHLSISLKLPHPYLEALFQSLPKLLAFWASLGTLSDTERAELASGLGALGVLVSTAVASTPAGQAIPAASFTAVDVVAGLTNWAAPGPERGKGEQERVVRVGYGDSVAIAATLALERLMNDEACEKVLFAAPYPLLGRFLMAVGPSIAATAGHFTSALVRAARSDPSGIFTVPKDTPLCSNRKWTNLSASSGSFGPPLFGHSRRCGLDSPAILEMTALFLRHWLGMRPPQRPLRSYVGGTSKEPPREIAALARSLGERLATCTGKLLSSGRQVAAGELLLGSMSAHILRALVLATEGGEQADLLKSVAPPLQGAVQATEAAKSAEGQGKGKAGSESEDILGTVLATLKEAIGMGPPGLAARLRLDLELQ